MNSGRVCCLLPKSLISQNLYSNPLITLLFLSLSSMALTLHQSGHGHSHGGLGSHGHAHSQNNSKGHSHNHKEGKGHAHGPNHTHSNGYHGDGDVEQQGAEHGMRSRVRNLEENKIIMADCIFIKLLNVSVNMITVNIVSIISS